MPTGTEAAWPVLLDTHTWIWLMDGVPGKLSKPALDAIHSSAASKAGVYISAISVWEIGTLEAKGRIALSMDLQLWVERALNAPAIRYVELSPSIALASSRLPGSPHGDPADRILIATARALNVALITKDEKILGYAGKGYLRAISA